MEYLKTFWRAVVKKVPYLRLKRQEQARKPRASYESVEAKLTAATTVAIGISSLATVAAQLSAIATLAAQLSATATLAATLSPAATVISGISSVLLTLVLSLKLYSKWQKQEKKVRLRITVTVHPDKQPKPETPKSLLEIKQQSHIKGWLSKTFLEEWRGELEALRARWLKENKPELWIKIMTGFHLLCMLKAYLQIQVENRWLPKKKQS